MKRNSSGNSPHDSAGGPPLRSLDGFSFLSPARIRTLLCPVALSDFRKSEFDSYVARLSPVQQIRLGDVTPDKRPERALYAPNSFPAGRLFYDFHCSLHPEPVSLEYTDLEPSHRTLCVLGIAKYSSDLSEESIALAVEKLKARYRCAILHKILVFDTPKSAASAVISPYCLTVPPVEESNITSLETVMCDVSSEFLAELAVYTTTTQISSALLNLLPKGGKPYNLGSSAVSGVPKRSNSARLSRILSSSGSSASLGNSSGLGASGKSAAGPMSVDSLNSLVKIQHLSSSERRQIISKARKARFRAGCCLLAGHYVQAKDEFLDAISLFRSAGVIIGTNQPTFSAITGTPAGAGSSGSNSTGTSGSGGTASATSAASLLANTTNYGTPLDSALLVSAIDGLTVTCLLLVYVGQSVTLPRGFLASEEKEKAAVTAGLNKLFRTKSASGHTGRPSLSESITGVRMTGGAGSTSSSAIPGVGEQSPRTSFTQADSFGSSQLQGLGSDRAMSPARFEADGVPATEHGVVVDLVHSLVFHVTNLLMSVGPQLSYTDEESLATTWAAAFTVVKLAKLCALLFLHGNICDAEFLEIVVRDEPPVDVRLPAAMNEVPTLICRSTVANLVNLLFVSQLQIDVLSLTAKCDLYGGMAQVYSLIGYHRKRAFILRTLFITVLPRVLQTQAQAMQAAQTAQAGGDAIVNGTDAMVPLLGAEGQQTLSGALKETLAVYGVSPVTAEQGVRKAGALGGKVEPSAGNLPGVSPEISAELSSERPSDIPFYTPLVPTWRQLQKNVAAVALSLCDGVQDPFAVVSLASSMLYAMSDSLRKQYQCKLHGMLTRAFKQIQMDPNGAAAVRQFAYWDPFIVRGVYRSGDSSWIQTKEKKLEKVGKAGKPMGDGVLIYNPFEAKEARPIGYSDRLLVEGEETEFMVCLQNPYEFGVTVTSVELVTAGDPTGAAVLPMESVLREATVVVSRSTAARFAHIQPFSTTEVTVNVKPQHHGKLCIVGCLVAVAGFPHQFFPIVGARMEMARMLSEKVKAMGGFAQVDVAKVPSGGVSNGAGSSTAKTGKTNKQTTENNEDLFVIPQFPGIICRSVRYEVIPRQPLITVGDISLYQGWMMLLEGETAVVDVDFINSSEDVNANYIEISVHDSTEEPLTAALLQEASRETGGLPPNEVFELEYFLLRKQAVRLLEGSECFQGLKAKQKQTVKFEVLGKRGTTSATIKMQYGNLVTPEAPSVFVRSLSIPLNVTVNSSIEMTGCDVLPLSSKYFNSIGAFMDQESGEIIVDESYGKVALLLKEMEQRKLEVRDYCLLVLDLRNNWVNSLEVCLEVSDKAFTSDEFDCDIGQAVEGGENNFQVKSLIPTKVSKRFILPVKRISFPERFALQPIPSLRSNGIRQNNNGGYSTEELRHLRETFWYRKELLRHLRGSWTEVTDGDLNTKRRSGYVELRGIRLSASMISVLQVESIGIEMRIESCQAQKNSGASVSDESTGESQSQSRILDKGSHWNVPSDEFVSLKTTIINRTDRPIKGVLRHLPLLRSRASPGHMKQARVNSTYINLDHEGSTSELGSPSMNVAEPSNISGLDRKIFYDGVLQMTIYPPIEPGDSLTLEKGVVFLENGEYEWGSMFQEIVDPCSQAGEKMEPGTPGQVSQLNDDVLKLPPSVVIQRESLHLVVS